MSKYTGDTILFYEWVQGMELYDTEEQIGPVMIRSPKDAEAVIESLTRYLETFEDDI